MTGPEKVATMIEIYGDLWQEAPRYDAVCITTNGTVRSDGRAVMGRGCAREAATRWPTLPILLGKQLQMFGNCTADLRRIVLGGDHDRLWLVSFPVKHRWQDDADIALIEESARQLVHRADARKWSAVLLPRPGCGNGRLAWSAVRPVIAPLLNDRFTVIAKPHERARSVRA